MDAVFDNPQDLKAKIMAQEEVQERVEIAANKEEKEVGEVSSKKRRGRKGRKKRI